MTRKALPAELIALEAEHLQSLPPRPAGRDAELAVEVERLNKAVAEAAEALSFDEQPSDFLSLLVALREREDDER